MRPPYSIIGRTARPSFRAAPVTSTLGVRMQHVRSTETTGPGPLPPLVLKYTTERRHFSVQLLEGKAASYDVKARLPPHDTVLAPLLVGATECFVYGLTPENPLFALVADLITPSRGKHRLELAGDPITGREEFWNAKYGRRGSIVILHPYETLNAAALFKNCSWVSHCTNLSVAHSPAALAFSRKKTEAGGTVAFLLSSAFGIAGLDIVANALDAETLLRIAWASAKPSEWFHSPSN